MRDIDKVFILSEDAQDCKNYEVYVANKDGRRGVPRNGDIHDEGSSQSYRLQRIESSKSLGNEQEERSTTK